MAKQVLITLDFNNASRITNLPAAVAAGQPVTYEQFQAAIEGMKHKNSVRVATQGNISLASPGATIDGIALALNDRVLVKAQTAAAENGIYVWNGAAVLMTRATDANTAVELESAIVTIEEGTGVTANGNPSWRQTSVNFTLGTDPVNWVPFGVVAPPASETVAGIVELATQGEVDTGTDPSRVVTALTLANSVWAKKKASGTFGDNSATQFDVVHNFGTRDVQVEVARTTAPYDTVLCDVSRLDVNTVRLNFDVAPASNQFRVTVQA